MKGQVLKKSNGQVVYMEVNKDFVEALGGMLHQPVGGLADKVGAANVGWCAVGKSLKGIREEVFLGTKAKMFPTPTAGTMRGCYKEQPAKKPTFNNSLCLNCGSLKTHGGNCRCIVCRQYIQDGGNYGASLYCATCPNFQVCVTCTSKISQTVIHDALKQDADTALATRQPCSLPRMKELARFIVTDRMEVFENSTIKAMQLMKIAGLDLAEMETEEVSITEERFTSMLQLVFLNRKDILTSVFRTRQNGHQNKSRPPKKANSRKHQGGKFQGVSSYVPVPSDDAAFTCVEEE